MQMAWFQVSFFSASLMRTVPINVLLPDLMGPPEALKAPRKPLRSLYLLNGYRGDHTDWLLNTDVNGWSRKYQCAIIMPSGENCSYVDMPLSGAKYSQFIGKELVDFTRKLFPLSHDREDTAISGLSMGGYGALHNGLRCSEVFGHVLPLSFGMRGPESIVDEESRARFEAMYGPLESWDTNSANPYFLAQEILAGRKPMTDLYISCGYNDSLCVGNRKYHHFLEEAGFPHVYEEGPGSHEWGFWRWALPRALDHCGWATDDSFVNPMWTDMRDERYLPEELKGGK